MTHVKSRRARLTPYFIASSLCLSWENGERKVKSLTSDSSALTGVNGDQIKRFPASACQETVLGDLFEDRTQNLARSTPAEELCTVNISNGIPHVGRRVLCVEVGYDDLVLGLQRLFESLVTTWAISNDED
jgi:hypothetical protein